MDFIYKEYLFFCSFTDFLPEQHRENKNVLSPLLIQ